MGRALIENSAQQERGRNDSWQHPSTPTLNVVPSEPCVGRRRGDLERWTNAEGSDFAFWSIFRQTGLEQEETGSGG